MAEGWRESLDNMNKNCISRLQEYAAKRGYEVRYDEISPREGGFGYEVYFERFVASGTGSRKKEAKEATADRALRSLYRNSGNDQPLSDQQSLHSNTDVIYNRQNAYCDSNEEESDEHLPTDTVSNELKIYDPVRTCVRHPVASISSLAKLFSRSRANCATTVSDGKHPISQFMEHAQANGEVGRIEEEDKWGPSHCPTFTMRAFLGKRKLAEGTAGNKKAAKRQAAEESLKMLAPRSSFNALTFPGFSPIASRPLIDKNAGICPPGADPISVLNEFAQRSGVELTFPDPDVSGPDHQRMFSLGAALGDTIYPSASASTKQEAKREASRNALKQLKQKNLYHYTPGLSTFTMSEPLTFHDKMAKLCNEKFDSVVADIPDNLAGRKVIAGIVMETESTHAFDVISLASGNRFIKGDALTTDGQVLVDSHAEILATRGMRRFLYYHLNKLCRGEETSVLQRVGEGPAEVAPGIKFHLYISTAPCGDGATFTHPTGQSQAEQAFSTGQPQAEQAGRHYPIFDDKKQGQLRTKVEQGEGHIPTTKVKVSHQYQGMDTVRSGERLRVMSCSDKICKWNILGMQGALLAQLMKAVYFSSITLGTLYNHGHMARAVCCRLEKNCQIRSLPNGYKVNHPLLGAVTRKEDPQRSVEKSTAHSINWNIADDCHEMTDGTTGLQNSSGYGTTTTISRLCKQELLRSYKGICTSVGLLNLIKDDYFATKNKSTQYQSCKKTLYATLHSQDYGTWVGLPRECQEFSTSSNLLPVVSPLERLFRLLD